MSKTTKASALPRKRKYSRTTRAASTRDGGEIENKDWFGFARSSRFNCLSFADISDKTRTHNPAVRPGRGRGHHGSHARAQDERRPRPAGGDREQPRRGGDPG